jgi:hypothetical protein
MPRYRVCFYKHLVNSDGHPFKCLQAQIDVRNCATEAQAAQRAAKTFEAAYGLQNWELHADAIEVMPLGVLTNSDRGQLHAPIGRPPRAIERPLQHRRRS